VQAASPGRPDFAPGCTQHPTAQKVRVECCEEPQVQPVDVCATGVVQPVQVFPEPLLSDHGPVAVYTRNPGGVLVNVLGTAGELFFCLRFHGLFKYFYNVDTIDYQ